MVALAQARAAEALDRDVVAFPRTRRAHPLRIGMVVTYDLARPGGVKHHAEHLARALRRGGDEVTLIGPSSQERSDAVTFRGIANVPANGSDNQLGIFVSPTRIRRYFAEQAFDVVHIHEPLQPALAYWAVWATRDVPHVATFHAYAEHESRRLRYARKAFGATVFPWFQRAIAVSPSAATYARDAWHRSLEVIPNGVATDLFTPRSGRRPGPFRLLFVGRLADGRKGASIALAAFRGLRARGYEVELDMVGDVGAFTVPELPGLRVHGAVGLHALTELYRDCDAFVAPATGQESFGIVLLEAMASGKPVVCSDIAGYRDVVRGTRTQLVPPGNATALEAALAGVIAKDRAQLVREGEHNRRHAIQFGWDRVAEAVRETYVAAIASKQRATVQG